MSRVNIILTRKLIFSKIRQVLLQEIKRIRHSIREFQEPIKTQTANHTININEWNIYWFEWRSDSEVALGINGQETVCYKKADCPAGYWTFTDEQNLNGLKFILTMGAPNKWGLGGGTEVNGVWSPDAGWDSGFASYDNYERDRDNNAIPRLEIDWVRTYINKSSVAEYDQGRNRHTGTKFY